MEPRCDASLLRRRIRRRRPGFLNHLHLVADELFEIQPAVTQLAQRLRTDRHSCKVHDTKHVQERLRRVTDRGHGKCRSHDNTRGGERGDLAYTPAA